MQAVPLHDPAIPAHNYSLLYDSYYNYFFMWSYWGEVLEALNAVSSQYDSATLQDKTKFKTSFSTSVPAVQKPYFTFLFSYVLDGIRSCFGLTTRQSVCEAYDALQVKINNPANVEHLLETYKNIYDANDAAHPILDRIDLLDQEATVEQREVLALLFQKIANPQADVPSLIEKIQSLPAHGQFYGKLQEIFSEHPNVYISMQSDVALSLHMLFLDFDAVWAIYATRMSTYAQESKYDEAMTFSKNINIVKFYNQYSTIAPTESRIKPFVLLSSLDIKINEKALPLLPKLKEILLKTANRIDLPQNMYDTKISALWSVYQKLNTLKTKNLIKDETINNLIKAYFTKGYTATKHALIMNTFDDIKPLLREGTLQHELKELGVTHMVNMMVAHIQNEDTLLSRNSFTDIFQNETNVALVTAITTPYISLTHAIERGKDAAFNQTQAIVGDVIDLAQNTLTTLNTLVTDFKSSPWVSSFF